MLLDYSYNNREAQSSKYQQDDFDFYNDLLYLLSPSNIYSFDIKKGDKTHTYYYRNEFKLHILLHPEDNVWSIARCHIITPAISWQLEKSNTFLNYYHESLLPQLVCLTKATNA